jgi:hypothetical protein
MCESGLQAAGDVRAMLDDDDESFEWGAGNMIVTSGELPPAIGMTPQPSVGECRRVNRFGTTEGSSSPVATTSLQTLKDSDEFSHV